MRLPALTLAMLGLCLTTAGCYPKASTGNPAPDRTVLTEDQFADQGYNNVYEVVAALRANWLNARGPDSFTSPTQVLAYYDGMRVGGVETLKTMDVRPVVYIRYFDGVSATARWGLGHGAGVVYVSSHPMSNMIGSRTP
jgi:hypothetical protein